MDIHPTLAELAGVAPLELSTPIDGSSLAPTMRGEARKEPVFMEYTAEASYAPIVSVREGRWKLNRCVLDPDQLYDLENDPHELHNLADDETYTKIHRELTRKAAKRWNLEKLDADVRASQQRRLVVYEALRMGKYTPWEYQPHRDASSRFMRNHMDLNVLEDQNRFPRKST